MTNSNCQIKLLALDMDGTLLNSDHLLNSVDFQAVSQARQRGIKIILASGRPPFAIEPFAKQLDLSGLMIAFSGAYLYSRGDGTVLLDRPLALQDRLKTLDVIREHDLYVSAHDTLGWYLDKDCPEAEWEADAMKSQPTRLADLVRQGPSRIYKLEVISLSDHGRLRTCVAALHARMPHLTIHDTGGHYFEVIGPGADKATALAYACGWLGITPDETMAIGNGVNDVSMLGLARLGVVVCNATPSVLAAADWVVASNDEGGVAEAIRQVLAGDCPPPGGSEPSNDMLLEEY